MRIKKFNEVNFYNNEVKLGFYAFDWDDNILRMSTEILMDKKVNGVWKQTSVSTSEFAEVRTDTENYRIRDNNPEVAFSRFRDDDNVNYFLEDTIKSIESDKTAPSWNKFLKCLSEGALFAIITARGHEEETLREGVEWIIDNVLTKKPSKNPGRSLADEMYQNLKKYLYYFGGRQPEDSELSGVPSENKIVKEYLDNCDFFGVSSKGFAERFDVGSALNPEENKKKALIHSIDRCVEYGKILSENLSKYSGEPVSVRVTMGMSDDDPKTSDHIKELFADISHERSLDNLELYYYQTTDRNIEGGVKTTFESTGVENSVVPFTKWNSMSQWYHTNSKHSKDVSHNKMTNSLGLTKDLYSSGRTLESFDEMSREEMIQHLCNFGCDMMDLKEKSDKELFIMCKSYPMEEVSEKRSTKRKKFKRRLK